MVIFPKGPEQSHARPAGACPLPAGLLDTVLPEWYAERKFPSLEDPSAAELAATAERFGLAPRAFFLHVGNNLPYKNIEGLLRALGELGRARRHEPRLVKVGAAPSPKQHRLAAACGVALRWIGEISASELRSVYHLAQCLVYPSLDEGFGWPVIEGWLLTRRRSRA